MTQECTKKHYSNEFKEKAVVLVPRPAEAVGQNKPNTHKEADRILSEQNEED